MSVYEAVATAAPAAVTIPAATTAASAAVIALIDGSFSIAVTTPVKSSIQPYGSAA